MSDARDDDDSDLFRAAIGPVRRLDDAPTPPRGPRPRPAARMAQADERAAMSEFRQALEAMPIGAGDVLAHRVEALPVTVFNRLKRGQFSVQDELDLHGATAGQAETALRLFLRNAQRSGSACVRIIHGKGLGSDAEIPVLKNVVDRVLRQRSDVLAFHSAPPAQGGTGAVLVLLAAQR
ncbi:MULTISPECIES: Smr/MutS family protein [Pseudoxanthomonas]|jgi:DNA-nicking Smr family endonuclease|uniref:SMR domain protein n=1 Tax=Pseudoxanthomonas winnipegensis TaxID=2480810 RepID=A0A4Q8L658_9GAMM|nr:MULTISPECIES: Smr/MutS family protein [Pseudoxanthomonas]PZP63318.1 MAG: SMR domain protein [Pseudoxanthomonas spadix]TAA21639.1 SMR domain protein [Pseudoxanthomonas winnipegensis]TMN25542.1 SMR domain protein [Pseudoxanthomonas sp. X-1]UAY76254.1 Smr/MutS family protein [Pseudoxanthomonas sp. X-1]